MLYIFTGEKYVLICEMCLIMKHLTCMLTSKINVITYVLKREYVPINNVHLIMHQYTVSKLVFHRTAYAALLHCSC